MELVYLDYNCFQRAFDDYRQLKIRLEALVCEELFIKAENDEIKLVWSFIHEDENRLCPFIERKAEVLRLSALCEVKIGPQDDIRTMAKDFQDRSGLSSKDALHLACAHASACTVFLTCDEGLLRRARRLNLSMKIMNPVDYVREVEKDEDTNT